MDFDCTGRDDRQVVILKSDGETDLDLARVKYMCCLSVCIHLLQVGRG